MKNCLQAPEIEEKIIGTLLFFPDLLNKVDGLIPDMFSKKELKFFYECIQWVNKRDGSHSIDTITEEVTKKTNTLEAVPYLTELYGKGFTDNQFDFNIKVVKEKYFLRKVIKESEANIELARKGNLDDLLKKINSPVVHDFNVSPSIELSRIDPLSELTEPPVYCKIGDSPTMTAGNFSLIDGKAKSGKTFFLGSIVASMLNNSNQLYKLKGSLPDNKKNILYFDTEQSQYHAVRTIQRICTLIDIKSPLNLFAYSLRPYTPAERLQFIEEKISKTVNLGAVAIDGVRDLLTIGINDEAEATSLTSKFLKWTFDYNMHLILLLHQNKTDFNARGHIGTELLNKAETTLSVSKDKSNIFIVSCEYSRDIAFDDFGFIIDNGMIQPADLPREEKSKSKNPQYIDDQKHFEVLDSVFRIETQINYYELQDKIMYGFNNSFGQTACRTFITYYLQKGWIIKLHDGNKKYYKYGRAIF